MILSQPTASENKNYINQPVYKLLVDPKCVTTTNFVLVGCLFIFNGMQIKSSNGPNF